MIAFAKRNLKLYLRDRSSVLFSLLAVFIVIGLYVLFLGDVWTEDLSQFDNARELMDNWVMAGVLAITSMTATLGMLGTMVSDKARKTEKDFYVAPVKRWQIAGGYLVSAYAVGVVMTLIALAAAEGYIVFHGGALIEPGVLARVLLMILLTSLMNTAIALFLVSIFKSMNAFATANTIVGTLIGFITGIYLPIGMYPDAVQWVIKIFPISHAALVFKNLMMGDAMNQAFDGVPAEVILDIKEELGIVYQFGGNQLSIASSVLMILLTAVLFFAFAYIKISRKQR